MIIINGKKTDKKEYLQTQKQAFPSINSKRDAKFFEEKIKKKEIFVITEKDHYAGHLCFGKHVLNPPFAGSVFIEELAIKKEFRGKGCGTALIEELVRFCKKKKIQVIILGTGDVKGNKTKKYYERQGFKKVGWMKDIIPNPEYDHPQIFYAVMVKSWKKA